MQTLEQIRKRDADLQPPPKTSLMDYAVWSICAAMAVAAWVHFKADKRSRKLDTAPANFSLDMNGHR